jgi:hypothetical protein
MCGGGCGPQTNYTYNNAIQPELMPYATQTLGTAQDLIFNRPFRQYQGQLTADINPMQQQGFGAMANMTPSAYTGQAANLYGMGANSIAQGQNIAGMGVNALDRGQNVLGQGTQLATQGANVASQAANLAGYAGTRDFSGANVNQYMSPYIQNVVSQQQQGAIRDYSKQLPGMGASAARAGGLGGSRNAILQAEGQRNLQQQLQDINARGLQSGYESARSQFNTANQNMLAGAQGMTAGAQGILSGAGQLGQMGGQFGQIGSQYGQLGGQFGQMGSQYGSLGSGMGSLGAQDYSQRMGIAQGQIGAGTQLQQMDQQRINAQYQQFINQQAEPYQRLAFMNSLIRGTPIQNVGSTMYQQPPSMGSQMLGTGMGIYGLNQAYGQGRAEGGEIKSYAGGGIVSLATGGSTPVEKMGAIDASAKQLSKSMPPQAANAKVQQTISALPDSVDWKNAAAMMAYNKSHPAVVEPPKQDSVVVQMAKQIAAQADAEKVAETMKAQQAQQVQAAMQQAQQQGIAGLPNPDIGQNFTPNGITAEPQGAPQGEPQVNAAEGGGIADLQAGDIGAHYADGGIVAFSGETGSEVEGEPVDESATIMNRLVNAVPGTGPTLNEMLNTTPGSTGTSQFRPSNAQVSSINGNISNLGAGIPGGSSILQSADAAKATNANLGPRAAAPSPLDQRPLGPINLNTAFNLAAPTLANAIPAATAAPAAPTRYPDNRYQTPVVAPQKQSGSGITSLFSAPKTEVIPGVEDKRLTDEEYFKKYQDYKEKSGLNKATSDISKFLDNEQVDAAKDAKYQRSLALAQFGFDIASTPGGLLRGIAAGGKGYASSLAAIKKEQSATERSLAKSRLELAQSVAKDDLGAWNKGLDNFRQDTKDLETLKMQRNQLVETQRHDVASERLQAEQNANTRKYYETLAAAQSVKTNATLEKYKNLFGAAIDKYAQTNDPKDKAAADHYQEVLQKLVDPTQTKLPAAVSGALAKDKGVEMAQYMLFAAQNSGDDQAIAEAQANLTAAQQKALATAGFTQQLSTAPGTGLNSLGGSTSGATFLGFE